MLQPKNIAVIFLGLCLVLLTYIAFFKKSESQPIVSDMEQQEQEQSSEPETKQEEKKETQPSKKSEPNTATAATTQYQHYEPEKEEHYQPVSIEERKNALKMQESLSPLSHLRLTTNIDMLTKKKGLLKLQKKFAGFEMDVSVYNTATLATFKDAEITIVYSSSTSAVIGREIISVYSFFYPGASVKKSQKINIPEGTSSYSAFLTSASVAYDR